MPDLLLLSTEEYELSIWTNNIEQRQLAHQKTLTKHQTDNEQLQPSPYCALLFNPAITFDTAHFTEQSCNRNFIFEDSAAIDKLKFQQAIFFENTQYQFEWIFKKDIASAEIRHWNSRISECFRFIKSSEKLPPRLTGTINTGNDLGWLNLELVIHLKTKRTKKQNFHLPVLPTKILIDNDLPLMYRQIDKLLPLWRFSPPQKTEQNVSRSQQRGDFPLMWLANFKALRTSIEASLKIISQSPHNRLIQQEQQLKADRIKFASINTIEKIQQDRSNGITHRRYTVKKRYLSIDTAENQFVKHAVSNANKKLDGILLKLSDKNSNNPDISFFSDQLRDDLTEWKKPFKKALTSSFLSQVSTLDKQPNSSLVLQQKTGYSSFYRDWQSLTYYLALFSNQATISMRSIAEIYEVWCFLCIKKILEELGFKPVKQPKAINSKLKLGIIQYADGLTNAFEFEREDGLFAKLAHEPSFTKASNPISSFTTNQKPDIVLLVSSSSETGVKEDQHYMWIFDAKYRLQDFDSSDAQDLAPDDAINQMHRYRDAIIYKEEQLNPLKSRPVLGAFALYPGFFDQSMESNPYTKQINEIGIGAFALLPNSEDSNKGSAWLKSYLVSQLQSLTQTANPVDYSDSKLNEHLSIQEAPRIPSYGMKQVLYTDLTMTISLGNSADRNAGYFECFADGSASWYHMPQSTFEDRFEKHLINEIRYLAIIHPSDDSKANAITHVWPIRSVKLLPRANLTVDQTGKNKLFEESDKLYFLFELEQSLKLKKPIIDIDCSSFRKTIKLTRLPDLNSCTNFELIKSLYAPALK